MVKKVRVRLLELPFAATYTHSVFVALLLPPGLRLVPVPKPAVEDDVGQSIHSLSQIEYFIFGERIGQRPKGFSEFV
jgi:hypothetical protein